ncbi:MAG: DUF4157 domain-containing protein [Acidimicrobiia bacterium]|jgi:hypothetical protein|nr:DUF4157 domain-containing protein [Acidimicrobiia bacterium]
MKGSPIPPEILNRMNHVSEVDASRARLVPVGWLPPGVDAMTIGSRIFVRRGHEDSFGLLAHELVHVEQWREMGAARFLTSYLSDYFRGRRQGLSHDEAYRAIPQEVEARQRSSKELS